MRTVVGPTVIICNCITEHVIGLIVYNLGFKNKYCTFQSLDLDRVDVEGLGIVGFLIGIFELIKLLLNLKFVLTLESHISFNWDFQSSPTYTIRFAHATLQFFGPDDNNLEWRMFFIQL